MSQQGSKTSISGFSFTSELSISVLCFPYFGVFPLALTVKGACAFITVCDTSETKESSWPKHNAAWISLELS